MRLLINARRYLAATKNSIAVSQRVAIVGYFGLTGLNINVLADGLGLEEIQVYGRKINLIGDAVSASQGRVSQEELQQRPLLRTGEVLETVPGLVATQHSGSGKANQYFLRGFNLDHGTDFATFVDAMPVNMRSHGHGQGYTDLNFIIPELIGELEYKKGSYYADVGDFGATGAAHIYTAHHLEQQRIEVGLGEDGFQRFLATGDIDMGQGDFIYGVEAQRYDGPWTGLNEDVNKTNVWLKQQWQGENFYHSLQLMMYKNRWNSADQIPQRAVDQGIIDELGSIDNSLGGESSRYSLSFQSRYQTQYGFLKANLYIIDYNMNLWSNFSYFTDPDGDQFKQIDDRTIYGWDLSFSVNSTLAGIPQTNTFGSQLRYDDIDKVGLQRSANREVNEPIRIDSVKQYSASLYWENTLVWSESFRTVIGVRYDDFSFQVDPLAAATQDSLQVNGGKQTDHISTAKFSAIYQPNDTVEIYASAGQGFHSNDARGTTTTQDPNSGELIQPADPIVKTFGYEVGLRSFLTEKLNASIALWHLSIDSELLFIGDEGSTEDTGVGSKRRGLELTSYYQLNDQLSIDFEAAFTDAKLNKSINGSDKIPGAQKQVFSAGINYRINERWYTHLRVRKFGDYPLDDNQSADGSTMVNVRSAYQFSPQLSVKIDVLNLFNSDDHDVEYFYESQLPGESAPVADRHYHVFEPRTLRVYLTYNY